MRFSGESHNIAWTGGDSTMKVSVDLYKGGTYNGTISSNVDNNGSRTWTIEQGMTPGSDYQVKVRYVLDSTSYDLSDGTFNINIPPLQVMSPNGGELCKGGETHTLAWTGGDPNALLDVQLYKGGNPYGTILSNLANTGSASWNIDSGFPSGGDYQVKITLVADPVSYDFSDAAFTIVPSIDAPTGVSASDNLFSDKVRVTWNTVNLAASYEVWRSTGSDSSTASKISPQDVTSTTYDDTSATVGTPYWYWVKAKNNAATSDFSTSDQGKSGIPPTPNPGGPYSGYEGSIIEFDASKSSDPVDPNTSLTYQWDLDYDGATFQIDATGMRPSVIFPDDCATRSIALRVKDSLGLTSVAATTLQIGNVAPSLWIKGKRTINEGDTLNLPDLCMLTDPGFDNPAAGTSETFTYSIDWGDGTTPDSDAVANITHGSSGVPPRGTFGDSHVYTGSGIYIITALASDDDGGVSTPRKLTVTANNVPPVITSANLDRATVNENDSVTVSGGFSDPGASESFTGTADWGDGTPISSLTIDQTHRTYSASHRYLDNPGSGTSGAYTIHAVVSDGKDSSLPATVQVTVKNVPPSLSVVGNQSVNEGTLLNLPQIGLFTDPGTLDTHIATIDWGDGSPIDTGIVNEQAGTIAGTHTYPDNFADNHPYLVTVTLKDKGPTAGSDGDSTTKQFNVTVSNVSPQWDRSGSILTTWDVNEGSSLVINAPFTDPGFNNPLSHPPTVETFTYTVDWGDGSQTQTGALTDVVQGKAGTLTKGTVHLNHVYGSNGVYNVSLKVTDDDQGSDTIPLQVTVHNVAPTLFVAGSQTVNEGSLLQITDIGRFTDPGFVSAGSSSIPETFSYRIDWGDGTTVDSASTRIDKMGSPGVLTQGSFDGSHTYGRAKTYTVTVGVKDDDNGPTSKTFKITVANVAPSLWLAGDQAATQGVMLSVPQLGVFSDPGFDTPPSVEKYTYRIDWSDGTAPDTGSFPPNTSTARIDSAGHAGAPTWGSFDGSHIYAKTGVFIATATITDGDGGSDPEQFQVTVNPAAKSLVSSADSGSVTPALVMGLMSASPMLMAANMVSSPAPLIQAAANQPPSVFVVGNLAINEGPVDLTNIGTFIHSDSSGPFTYRIDWGDGTTPDCQWALKTSQSWAIENQPS
jgi:hypothetical protein